MATEGTYKFIGNNQPEFNTLLELLSYYRWVGGMKRVWLTIEQLLSLDIMIDTTP